MTDITSIKKELAPCPFCGGDGILLNYDERMFFVSCNDCYCCVGEGYDRDAMPEHMFHNAEEATAAWNRRASYEQLEAENARLAAQLKLMSMTAVGAEKESDDAYAENAALKAERDRSRKALAEKDEEIARLRELINRVAPAEYSKSWLPTRLWHECRAALTNQQKG